MSTLTEELTAIKAVEDKLTANKVANFAYTDYAYNNPLTEADGVASYDADAEQNIPLANTSVLNVNSTVLTKGWRAQASSITRMLMNHFLGRCSYNLNKINDLFSTLLTKLMTYMGEPNGLATLDENGHVPSSQVNVTRESLDIENVVNTGDSDVPVEDGMDKFTTGGAYVLKQALSQLISERAPKNHASSTGDYGIASNTEYGHVKKTTAGIQIGFDFGSTEINVSEHPVGIFTSGTDGASFTIRYFSGTGEGFQLVVLTITSSQYPVLTTLTASGTPPEVNVSIPMGSTVIVLSQPAQNVLRGKLISD